MFVQAQVLPFWQTAASDDDAGETGGSDLILQHSDTECFDY